jgi:ribosomal protein L37AE/L43A
VAGNHPWIEVPAGTTLADVQWTDESEKYQKNKLKPGKWDVEGSTGKKYTVKRDENDIWSCSCVGFGFRSRCKHITQIKELRDGQKSV